MSLGVVMLCHTAFDRAAQVARHWASRGCPVVIHVDKRVSDTAYNDFVTTLSDVENIRFSSRHVCEWGTWGIVAATQEASRLILSEFADVSHVYLASGSCLPLRPIQDLRDYLLADPKTDYIESVTTQDVGWTVGGLDAERFTLRFPFSWRKHRILFDRYVDLQRRLKWKRRIPQGLVPHLGSQWWCLTRSSLDAILNHPRRDEIDSYFRKVWIPDESYFQTMVRQVSDNVESRSLTLAKFDFQGKPHIFYDDHLQLLRRSDCFVARKIWSEADGLYQAFLTDDRHQQANAEPKPGKIDRLFSKAIERRKYGRAGLYMQSRFPREGHELGRTAASYSVFCGFDTVFDNFEGWLSTSIGTRVHGHLFAPDRVEYAAGATVYNGAMSDSAALRDYNPKSFLTNLIWNTRGERQCFQYGPHDVQSLSWFMAMDVNAHFSIISGAWMLGLYHSNKPFAHIRREAARLQKIEQHFLDILQSNHMKGRLRLWSLAEFLEDPIEPLQLILDELAPRYSRKLTEAPPLIDMEGFGAFLQRLRNEGMQPVLVGDYRHGLGEGPKRPKRGRQHNGGQRDAAL